MIPGLNVHLRVSGQSIRFGNMETETGTGLGKKTGKCSKQNNYLSESKSEDDSRNHVAVFAEISEYRHIFVLLSQKSRYVSTDCPK